MEIGTEANDAIVREVYERVIAATAAKRPVTTQDQIIYDVNYLVMETNSGASYEQYFRWATPDEIGRVVNALRAVGLEEVAVLTEEAIGVAFPGGVPADPVTKEEATYWSEEQEELLNQLFAQLENCNGQITNALGRYAGSLDA